MRLRMYPWLWLYFLVEFVFLYDYNSLYQNTITTTMGGFCLVRGTCAESHLGLDDLVQ